MRLGRAIPMLAWLGSNRLFGCCEDLTHNGGGRSCSRPKDLSGDRALWPSGFDECTYGSDCCRCRSSCLVDVSVMFLCRGGSAKFARGGARRFRGRPVSMHGAENDRASFLGGGNKLELLTSKGPRIGGSGETEWLPTGGVIGKLLGGRGPAET